LSALRSRCGTTARSTEAGPPRLSAEPPRSHLPVSLRPHIVAAATLVLLALTGCATSVDWPPSSAAAPLAKAAFPGQFVPVLYAVDGDTLRVRLIEGRRAYVRLIGIDTPEDVKPGYPTECGAKAAAASMRRLAPARATVLLRPDSVAASRDRYGRILAHAFIKGRQLELAQLRRGWAYVYRYEGQRFDGLPAFEAAERHARQAHLGVWGGCHGDFHSSEPGVQG
jgi:endonuclease YncB( thermonuclease family)